jgi:hypothetical protein
MQFLAYVVVNRFIARVELRNKEARAVSPRGEMELSPA